DALKEVVEDMTALKDDLGIQGVFSSTSLASTDQWRWQTHLANLPVYYEYRDADVDTMSELTFKYGKQYQNIFDLYINNSTNAPGLLGAKTTTDSMTEFALGQSAMVQNGNWGWGQISGTEGNVVNEEDVHFMPIYTGVEGEENQGLAIGTENFMAVNSQASEEDIQASLDFIEWMYSSETGKDYVVNQFGFIPTFNTFGEDEFPTDPLAQDVLGSMNDESKYSVPWTFTTFPSEAFKNDFGNGLLMYAQDQATWDEVETTVVDAWAREAALTQQ
ncbi:extracellular solute-binding protein, partial [Jeotgalibaca porci]